MVYHYEIGQILFLFHMASLKDLIRRNKVIERTLRIWGKMHQYKKPQAILGEFPYGTDVERDSTSI